MADVNTQVIKSEFSLLRPEVIDNLVETIGVEGVVHDLICHCEATIEQRRIDGEDVTELEAAKISLYDARNYLREDVKGCQDSKT